MEHFIHKWLLTFFFFFIKVIQCVGIKLLLKGNLDRIEQNYYYIIITSWSGGSKKLTLRE